MNSFNPHNEPAMGTIVVSILQIVKLSLSGHTAGNQQTGSRIQALNHCATQPLAVMWA